MYVDVYLCGMDKRIIIGRRRNTLLRYKVISEEFDLYDQRDVPVTKTYRRYIYPKFFISRDTLYRIFSTDIEGELAQLDKQLEELDRQPTQMSIF